MGRKVAGPAAHASLPCLYIDIYSLSAPEKTPQDAAEDNPSLRPVLPSFFLLFIIIIISNRARPSPTSDRHPHIVWCPVWGGGWRDGSLVP